MTTAAQPIPATAVPRSGAKVLAALNLSVCLFAVLAALLAPEEISAPFITMTTLTAFGLVILQLSYQFGRIRETNWFSVEILFMLGFLIVHFVFAFFWIAGLVPGTSKIWFSDRVVCFSSAMSLAGLAAFGFGFNLIPDRFPRAIGAAYWDKSTLVWWRNLGIGIFLFGGVTTIAWLMLARDAFAVGGYVHVSELPYSARITFLLADVSLRLGLALASVAAAQLTGRWKIGIVPKIGLVVFIGMMLILGDRSAAVGVGVLVLAAYSEYVRRISLKMFIPALIAGIMVLGVVRIVRQHSRGHSAREFIETARLESHELTWQDTILNFGASIQTVHAAADTMPDQRSFYYGKLQVSTVLGIVPFTRRFLSPESGFTTSARVITDIINRPSQKSGRGTSVVADLYCDLGLPGVIGVLFLLGWLCKRVQQHARATSSITWAVAHVSLVTTMAVMPRYAVAILVRGVLWPVLAVCFLSWLLQLKKNAAYDVVEVQAQPE